MTLKSVIEALVFASPKPISTKEILAALRAAGEKAEEDFQRAFAKAKEPEVLEALASLGEDYQQTGRAFQLVEQVVGWAFVTLPFASPWVRHLYPEAKPTRLSGPQLETLAIIAYRQPVTRADIEAVRGVAVDGVMQVLLDRSLIRIAGRAELPGRPLLYHTSEYFLQHFGLKTTDELPNSSELKRIALPKAPVPAEAPPAPAQDAPAEAPAGQAAPVAEPDGADGSTQAPAVTAPVADAEPDTVHPEPAPEPPSHDTPAEVSAPADQEIATGEISSQ